MKHPQADDISKAILTTEGGACEAVFEAIN